MAIVDYSYYSSVYMGTEAAEASFPSLCARAEDLICSMTRWAVTEDNISSFASLQITLIKKAICAQVDFFAINGTETITGGTDQGFTVGKVSVSAKATTNGAGKLSGSISPMALAYLEQSGLMNPSVPVVGWWC